MRSVVGDIGTRQLHRVQKRATTSKSVPSRVPRFFDRVGNLPTPITEDARFVADFEQRLNSHLGSSLSIFKLTRTLDRDVMSVQHCGQPRQRTLAGDFAEVTFGFEHPGCGPAQNHGSALPAFDPPCDLAHPAEQVLDQVG